MSRSGLVERAAGIASDSDHSPDCLPSLAMLQGLVTRCGMLGETRQARFLIGQDLKLSTLIGLEVEPDKSCPSLPGVGC